MSNISPGVYTKIISLSSYVQAVPSTIGFIPALTMKGEDNVLKFIGSRSQLISEYGEPNITEFGKNYGQGLYFAYNFLGESGALYFMRPMPPDSVFSNLRISYDLAAAGTPTAVKVSYVPAPHASTINGLKAKLNYDVVDIPGDTTATMPLCVLRPVGRGQYYNNISIRFTPVTRPLTTDLFVIDIYEIQADGAEAIVESFEVSFDPNSKDQGGDSNYIVSVLERFSNIMRVETQLNDATESYAPGYDYLFKIYDKNMGITSLNCDSSDVLTVPATITDQKQDFTQWSDISGDRTYVCIATDDRGNKIYGWIGGLDGDIDTCMIYSSKTVGVVTRQWNLIDPDPNAEFNDITTFNFGGSISYVIKKSVDTISTVFEADPLPLRKGSDGAMRGSMGEIVANDPAVDKFGAEEILAKAYLGTLTSKIDNTTIVNDVMDTEDIYFSVVFDCGYPDNVRKQANMLVTTRRDCVGILDNGDNSKSETAIQSRLTTNTYNNFYTALYEGYNKVYDTFTGQDIWVSPCFHMSYLLPRNDNVAQIWNAVAGFSRGMIETIKELRYSPKLGERDQFYLKQLNPVVKFNEGYVVWGNLTTQAKADTLQNLSAVRLVLYIKRALERFCRYYIFENNDPITWGQVQNGVVSFLEDIKRARGLRSYSVNVYATEYMLKSKTFAVDVTLDPMTPVERIELTFFIR